MDDRSIVALYLRRDETAIRQTAEKYGSRLRTLAYGIVNDLQTAEECENDTYMEAWRTIPPHEPSDHFYAFLARITRRYWYLDSVADIAKRYGISESKVKTTLFRCRNRLREYLNKEGYTV